MKILTIVLLIWILYPLNSIAQQNLFNIPSGQMTPEKKLFYQHQMNFFDQESIASKQHIAYGLTNTFEIGFNFLNYYPLKKALKDNEKADGPEDNIGVIALQKSIKINRSLSANLGTQMGLSHMGTGKPLNQTAFNYGLLSMVNTNYHLRVTGGGWVSDKRFNGPGDVLGLMGGFEWMYSEGWYLMGDWVSGDTKNSVSVIGGMVDVASGIQVCYGYLIPNPKSQEGHGLVLELNLFNM